MYYLQSRYYDPEVCRFINADCVIYRKSFLGQNLFAYCENNPVVFLDSSGLGKTYVIAYDSEEHGFSEQVNNSGLFSTESDDVIVIEVVTSEDFVNAWNSIDGDVDNIYLYLHGEKSTLCFYSDRLTFPSVENGTTDLSFADLLAKKVNNYIYLYACSGGDGQSKSSVAYYLSEISDAPVVACRGSVSFSKIKYWVTGKCYPRFSLNPLHFGTWGVFHHNDPFLNSYSK